MRLVDGGTLGTLLAATPPAPGPAARRRTRTGLRAVHFAHSGASSTATLKPGNVLIDADGHPYVADFGLVKHVEGESGVTQSGAILGTPSYMAPEQARADRRLTTAVDVWFARRDSLRDSDRPPAVPRRIGDRHRPPGTGTRTRAPVSCRGECRSRPGRRCLKVPEKDPTRRYDSAAALADELVRWLNGEPIAARPAGAIRRTVKWAKRRPAVAALVATLSAVVVLAAVGLAMSLAQTRSAFRDAERQLYLSRVALTERELCLRALRPRRNHAAEGADGAPRLGMAHLRRRFTGARTPRRPTASRHGLRSSADGSVIVASASDWRDPEERSSTVNPCGRAGSLR